MANRRLNRSRPARGDSPVLQCCYMWDLAEGRRKLGCLFAPGATAAYPEIAGMPVPPPPVDLELMPGEPLACYNMAVVPGRRWRTPVRHIPPA